MFIDLGMYVYKFPSSSTYVIFYVHIYARMLNRHNIIYFWGISTSFSALPVFAY